MKAIVFLADGFEEVEALTVVDYLRRVDIDVTMTSITDDLEVKGAHDIVVKSDKSIDKLENIESYDAVIIPGGLPGATNLRDDEKVIEIVKDINDKGKLVAAICAGPIVLDKAGVLKNKNVTSYPGFEDQLKDTKYLKQSVVKDINIITSRGPSLAVDFAIEIVRELLGEESVKELKKDILYS